MLEIEKSIPSPTPETTQKLEDDLKSLDVTINLLEGKMTEFLPCPIALCTHNYKFKAVKRPADLVIRLAKFTAKTNKNLNPIKTDFVFPRKTVKNVPVKNNEQISTNNSFAALNTANKDAEDVTLVQYKLNPFLCA
ncbi:hypothetical protein TNIN_288301 [Trichonephila inaurata madagascariensis]|uniref:Uncharacterized protein n=1 Tax=Trichonephila inaurata madagascariensis TaxID=2747483 RepID=A0A8X6J434_9ARAC|nr:hypothetical protein TNIN_288301 [Trichonephila inaurata madagascariensis]